MSSKRILRSSKLSSSSSSSGATGSGSESSAASGSLFSVTPEPSSSSGSEDRKGKPRGLRRNFETTRITSPAITPIPHKRLKELLGVPIGRMGLSPALHIPASPMMSRLGYGTGVGVYTMDRSPALSGAMRSPWAIKKLLKNKIADNKIYTERLEHEANVLKQLTHPNIIGFRAFTKPKIGRDRRACLALEKASTSLADLIEIRYDEMCSVRNPDPNPFPPAQIEKVALDVAQALHYLHTEKRMIHGDLKSGNVLVFGDFETMKLCDFGVSRNLKEDGTVEGTYIGTWIWNSNEVEVMLAERDEDTAATAEREVIPITHKADVYAYGLTIYEMISLHPPHIPTILNETDELYEDASLNYTYEEGECLNYTSEDGSSQNATFEEDKSNADSSSEFETSVNEQDAEANDPTEKGQIGSRPNLPAMDFSDAYSRVLQIFYLCTEFAPKDRPDAADVIALLTDDKDPKSASESKSKESAPK